MRTLYLRLTCIQVIMILAQQPEPESACDPLYNMCNDWTCHFSCDRNDGSKCPDTFSQVWCPSLGCVSRNQFTDHYHCNGYCQRCEGNSCSLTPWCPGTCVSPYNKWCEDSQSCILSHQKCSNECEDWEIRCQDGSCVSYSDLCETRKECDIDEYTCDKGETCYTSFDICDGHQECGDGLDEKYCASSASSKWYVGIIISIAIVVIIIIFIFVFIIRRRYMNLALPARTQIYVAGPTANVLNTRSPNHGRIPGCTQRDPWAGSQSLLHGPSSSPPQPRQPSPLIYGPSPRPRSQGRIRGSTQRDPWAGSQPLLHGPSSTPPPAQRQPSPVPPSAPPGETRQTPAEPSSPPPPYAAVVADETRYPPTNSKLSPPSYTTVG